MITDDQTPSDRHGPRMQARHIAKALYETWRAWAEMRGHKTKPWNDADDGANQKFIDNIGPYLVKREVKAWKPFPSPTLVGGRDGALQVELRQIAGYLLDASPHQAKPVEPRPADTGNKTVKRYCAICDNEGSIQGQGAGPETCPRAGEPWHLP